MKKLGKALVLGTAMLGLAGAAGAAEIDLNIYGASAQFLFWNAAGPSFLTNVRGCTATSQLQSADGKHGITRGTGCDGGANNINLRYSAKASYDGPFAVFNSSDPQADLSCGSSTPALRNQRKMIVSISNNTTACQPVHLGASDVAVDSFTQYSEGNLFGPNGGVYTTRSFGGITVPPGVVTFQPVVVPFGFFVNKNVKVYTCENGSLAGNLCTPGTVTADCGSGNTCSANSLTNISREMAVQIFTGNIGKWSDFGASYFVDPGTDNSLVTCLRHAGSGTHASMVYALMNNGLWGGAPAQFESSTPPIVWFNDGSTDEMKCVNQLSGAIGYADADQGLGSFPNTAALKYQGVTPARSAVRNGQYDFFANQWLYENTNNTPVGGAQDTLANQLSAFASVPANVPASKAAFWATKGEMRYNKGTDQQYPAPVAATNPQIP